MREQRWYATDYHRVACVRLHWRERLVDPVSSVTVIELRILERIRALFLCRYALNVSWLNYLREMGLCVAIG